MQEGVLYIGLYAANVYLYNIVPKVTYQGPVIAVLFINALVARFTDGTTIYVVPTPSKPKVKPGAGESEAAKTD